MSLNLSSIAPAAGPLQWLWRILNWQFALWQVLLAFASGGYLGFLAGQAWTSASHAQELSELRTAHLEQLNEHADASIALQKALLAYSEANLAQAQANTEVLQQELLRAQAAAERAEVMRQSTARRLAEARQALTEAQANAPTFTLDPRYLVLGSDWIAAVNSGLRERPEASAAGAGAAVPDDAPDRLAPAGAGGPVGG
jgi:hypothetical protein